MFTSESSVFPEPADSVSTASAPAPRSSLAETRNPLLKLPAARKLVALPPEPKSALRSILLELRADAQANAEKCWRRHKAPMAVYWKCVAVYAGHIARVLRA